MNVAAPSKVLGTLVGLAILLFSCSRAGGPEVTPETPLEQGQLNPEYVTLNEAQSRLPFEIVLPSFIPPGASRTPELGILKDSTGLPDSLAIIYFEDRSAPARIRPLQFWIIEDSGDFITFDNPDMENLDVGGVSVEFAVNHFGIEEAQIMAGWNHGGIEFSAYFYWFPDGQTKQGVVTDQMRADALRVIKSVIDETSSRRARQR